jgi:hypothetical protein
MLAEVVSDPSILEVLHQIEDGVFACGILLFLILLFK